MHHHPRGHPEPRKADARLRSERTDGLSGTLFVVATPIGNLEDITLRALRVLREADLVACEDTRRTRALLTHFDIHKPTVSYYEQTKLTRGPQLLRDLADGRTIALVTDAGTPGISDPGILLVREARAQGIRVVPIPGPAAVVTALSASGLAADGFVFDGFLPVKPGKRLNRLRALREMGTTVVLYESPHRIVAALTAQNSLGVQGVFDLPPEFVSRQLDSVLSDFGADAIKIGMLSTAPIIAAVAERLRSDAREKIVLDPVMIAKSGDPLLQPEARTALMKELLPLALVVTPNLHEAEALAGIPVATESDMEEAARRLLALGPRNGLGKGGHLRDSATDILWHGRDFARVTAPRLASTSTHGTGCTLSSAIAACLARGHVLKDAVSEAKAYVTAAIREGFQPGGGVGALRHFVASW